MARRKLPKLDICKLNPQRFRDMNSKQLWAVWKRLGMSAPVRRNVISKVKGLVSNLATAKGIRERGGRNYEGYQAIAMQVERELWNMQAKAGCRIKETELVARDAEREGRHHDAARLRRKPIIR